MTENTNIVNHISTLLDNGKYKEALSVPNEEKFINSFKDSCWDITAIVIGKIQDDTIIIKPSLYGACEQLLSIIIGISTPEESLLEFIEQIELAKNDAQLGIILQPLRDVMQKLSMKRSRSLEWCLNSLSTYIDKIPIPDYQLEEQERLLLDADANVRRAMQVYSLLPPFYRPFILQINGSDDSTRTAQIITAFLISLLGKPLMYIDLDPEANAQSEARLICNSIIEDICILEKNLFKFLVNVEVCYREQMKKTLGKDDNENETSPYDNRDKINITTISSMFYVVFSGHFKVPEFAIPQVYCLDYVVNTIMLCAIHLLGIVSYGPLSKGVALCKAILNRCPSKMSHKLFTPVYVDLCKVLVNVTIYSGYKSISKEALAVIGGLVNKFDYKGRCILVKFLIEISNHSGMIGYAITLYKNSIDEAFGEPILDECFTGAQLTTMLKKICHLPHGAESDLVELADQIITALNFLRYLTIRDVNNRTGISDNFSFIENDYLEKLRVGLNMSKAHYEVKLKDIDEGRDMSEGNNVTINIGGNILDKIPTENKKEILCSALNTFHLIEGLIARLSECMNVQKMQELKMNCD